MIVVLALRSQESAAAQSLMLSLSQLLRHPRGEREGYILKLDTTIAASSTFALFRLAAAKDLILTPSSSLIA